MYGLPGSLIQFGVKRAKKRPGRKSAQAQFLEKQRDLFSVDLYTAKLSSVPPGQRYYEPERRYLDQAKRDAAQQFGINGNAPGFIGWMKHIARGYQEQDKAPATSSSADARDAAGGRAAVLGQAQKLYVPVTRKVSSEIGTRTHKVTATSDSQRLPEEPSCTEMVRKVSLTDETKTEISA